MNCGAMHASTKNLFFLIPAVTYLLVLFIIPSGETSAQVKVTSALIKQDTTITSQPVSDTLNIQAGAIGFAPERRAKSGNLAMLFSAILPGSGQIYAHRYYTIPLIWGFGTYFVTQWKKADKIYKDYQRKFIESVPLDTIRHTGNLDLQSNRDDWHNYRDSFTFYLALTYILNIVDAYVGAVLYNFDVSDNLGGSAQIQFRIPLH
jgi:hypothetical protein